MTDVNLPLLRESGHAYASASQTAVSAAKHTAIAGHEVGVAIEDGALSAAFASAMVKVAQQMQLVGGATSYAADQLGKSADTYTSTDHGVSQRFAPGGGVRAE